MKKFVCIICGYVHEGDCPPEKCPICGAGAEKFKEQTGELSWAAEHEVGIAEGIDPKIVEGLRENFNGECTEVGMYLAMSRVADREGYPEVAEAYKRIAFEEAEHAAKFAEMLGEVVTASTKKNLELRVAAENGATLNSRFFLVDAVTTSPNISANLAACSASSKAILLYASATSG